MIRKYITKQELKGRADLKTKDKKLIERLVWESNLDYPDSPKCKALRGLLVQEMDDLVIDNKLRSELPGEAASFSEGWDAAVKYLSEQGIPDHGEPEETKHG